MVVFIHFLSMSRYFIITLTHCICTCLHVSGVLFFMYTYVYIYIYMYIYSTCKVTCRLGNSILAKSMCTPIVDFTSEISKI